MFPAKNLELYFWNDKVGDMDCEAFDLNYANDLQDVYQIEILLMDYPVCDEVAIVTYIGDHPTAINDCPLYTVDDDDNVIYTTVVYSPNPEYNDVLLSDSPKEAARYTLYSKPKHINRIERFAVRENPFDIPDWSEA